MAFTLKDYQILDEIGRGGFGFVLRARQKSLGRPVAIKCLNSLRTQSSGDIERFRREAQAMAALAHDNIVSVFDYAYHDGNYYIVMEYIEGMTLEQALERGLEADTVLYVLHKTVGGLRCAHESGILHRDLKPSNILLGKNGQVKLADFGVASFSRAETVQSKAAAVGTLWYMAPESMVNPRDVDGRADVFSIGCMLYEALSGKVPFPGENIGEVSYRVLNEPPPEFENLSDDLTDVGELTLRCLSKKRDDRPSVEQLTSALADILRKRDNAPEERLVTFIRGDGGEPVETAQTSMAPSKIAFAPFGLPKTLRFALPLFLLTVLAGAAFLHYRGRTPDSSSSSDSLPRLESVEEIKQYHRAIPRSRRAKKLPPGAPAPIAAEHADGGFGKIVIHGLNEGDSVTVDGAGVSPVHDSEGAVIELGSGRHTIRVHEKGGGVARKIVEIVPFQILEWNVGRMAHD